MKILDNSHIQTRFGVLGGVVSYSTFESGELKDVTLEEKNMVLTHAGELVPFYSEETPRRKRKPSVTFHENGLVKSVALDSQTEITTPIGEFPAELVSFYSTGELKRFFPLDGKITGFWSEEEERKLNIPFHFDLGFTEFSAMLIGICFYKSGDIKSVTLFPGETVEVTTKYGIIPVRNGFSLYESGVLQSCEPASPFSVSTPIGKISAFDPCAVGINADTTSLQFDEQGNVTGLVTSTDKIAATAKDGRVTFFSPEIKRDPVNEESLIAVGIKIGFDYDKKSAAFETSEGRREFSLDDTAFNVIKGSPSGFCSPSDCAHCSLCSH